MSRAAAGKAKPDLARRWLGETDHDIPRFGFLSGAVVCAALVVAVFVVPPLAWAAAPGRPWVAAIASGTLVGLTVAAMQYFHETHRGAVPSFWLVAAGLSTVLSALFLILFA